MLYNDLDKLTSLYPQISVETVEKTVLKRDIPLIIFGTGSKKIFLNASHHSLESITSYSLMGFCFDFLKAYEDSQTFYGGDARLLFDNVKFYIMPMINPDGVELAVNGISKDDPNYSFLKKSNHVV